ncbi:hypothetical protein OIO90_003516 [Microbotryomycetes sp. JL221]|nr:hypothetical protein OIO90_003516 [Microbotryomycetes sp. JL221]
MSEPHTDASLKALTVAKLKELLSEQGLPVSGKKDELVARLLEAQSSSATNNGTAQQQQQITTADASSTTTATATQQNDATTAASASAPAVSASGDVAAANGATPAADAAKPASVELTAEQRAERNKQEEDKRKARLARFGGQSTDAINAADDALKKRAERFGVDQSQDDGLDKSIDKLDQPLGSKRERPAKTDKSKQAQDNKGNNNKKPNKQANPAIKDKIAQAPNPELQKKLAEEEEKKRKRAERFGAPQATGREKGKD